MVFAGTLLLAFVLFVKADNHSQVAATPDPLDYAKTVSSRCYDIVRNSTLYDEQCFTTKPAILRKLLVTGAGGCGTHHAVDTFAAGGVRLSHEKIGVHGSSSWTYAVNDYITSGWTNIPVLKKTNATVKEGYVWGRINGQNGLPDCTSSECKLMSPRFQNVFHQTRCPLLNIAALLTHGVASASFIASALGLERELPSADCFLHKDKNRDKIKNETKLASMEDCDVKWAMRVYYEWNLFIEKFATFRYRVEKADSKKLVERAGFTYVKHSVISKYSHNGVHHSSLKHSHRSSHSKKTKTSSASSSKHKTHKTDSSSTTSLKTKDQRKLKSRSSRSKANHRSHVHGSPEFFRYHDSDLWTAIVEMAARYGYGFKGDNSTECVLLSGEF